MRVSRLLLLAQVLPLAPLLAQLLVERMRSASRLFKKLNMAGNISLG